MALQAGAFAIGADFQNLEVLTHAPLDTGTTSSTSFTTTRSGGTTPVGVAFTAPPSGKVKVEWAAGMTSSTTGATAYVLITYQLRAGSTLDAGTVLQSGTDNISIQNNGTETRRGGASNLLTGLTPGSTYNVTLMYRVGTGTGTIIRVECIVTPCIA